MKKIFPLLMAIPGAPAVFSDSPGLTVGAAGWYYDISGTARYQSDDPANNVYLKLNLDDFDDSFADVEFDGPFAGAYFHF